MLVFLTRPGLFDALGNVAKLHGIAYTCISTSEELEKCVSPKTVLIAFSTGVIVSKKIIDCVKYAYNFHPSSPQFPGRDPHYWAKHCMAIEFGSTVHIMTPYVDAGAIIATRLYKVQPNMCSEALRIRSEVEMFSLLEDMLLELYRGKAVPSGERWQGIKRTRKDFFSKGLKFDSGPPDSLPVMNDRDMANAYYFGIRCEQDKDRAKKYYEFACSTGNSDWPVLRLAYIAYEEGHFERVRYYLDKVSSFEGQLNKEVIHHAITTLKSISHD